MIAIKYSIFAIISILLNIFSQWFAIRLNLGIYIAIVVGTLVGLVVKYFLDKNFIFYYKTDGFIHNGRKFILYSFMGVFTTFIFWLTEILFYMFFKNPYSQYFGAVVGLTVGYFIKYRLDKRLVFRR